MPVAYGFFVMAGQAVLLREMLELFRGNEAAVGVLLFVWLAGNGLGAAKLRLLSRAGAPAAGRILLAAALALPAAVLAARILSGILRYQAVPGMPASLFTAGLLIFPVSFLLGACFSALAAGRGRGAARVYFLESAGAFLGGLAYVPLAGRLDSLEICFFLLCAAALWVVSEEKIRPLARAATLLAWLSALGLWLPFGGRLIDEGRTLAFPGTRILSAVSSRYGNLVLSEKEGMESAYYGGRILYASDDPAFEEMTALPLLAARSHRRILVAGFPPPPLLRGLLAAGCESLTVVFADPALSGLFREESAGEDWKRVRIFPADPFRWCARATERFDLILVVRDLPVSVSDGRYFSDGFYRSLTRLAGERGLVALALDYHENAPGLRTLRRLSAVREALRSRFRHVDFAPAGKLYFFASNAPVAAGERTISERLRTIGGDWRLVNAGYVGHYFSESRRERFRGLLEQYPAEGGRRNFGMSLYREGLKDWLARDLGETAAAAGLLAAVLLYFGVRARRNLAAGFSADARSLYIFFSGFAGMASEIQFLYFFQGVSGALYYAYGLLAGVFMLGLAAGSGWAARKPGRGDGFGISLLAWTAAVAVLFAASPRADSSWWYVILLVANFWGGWGLGGVFAREAAGAARGGTRAQAVSAKLYSFDLFGGAAAALIGPLVLIPFLGHVAAASVSFFLLLAALTVTRRRRHAA